MIEIITPLTERVEHIQDPTLHATRMFTQSLMKQFIKQFSYDATKPMTIDAADSRAEVRALLTNIMSVGLLHPKKFLNSSGTE